MIGVILGPLFGWRVIEARLFHQQPVVAPAPLPPVLWIILGALGTAMIVAGIAVYGVVLLTGCFTFDYRRSFMRNFGRRVLAANVLTIGLTSNGISFIAAPFLTAVLWRIIPGAPAIEIGWFIPFVAATFSLLLWFHIWAPLDLMVIHRRMRALGVHAERIAMGVPIGTTDPDRKRRRFLAGMVEEDLGMLWLDAEQLLFFGDMGSWSITHDQLLSIDRLAHKRAITSHFGAINVVLRFRRVDGSEGRVLLFSEGTWTHIGQARALDKLADRLVSWREGARPLPPAMGFAVIGAGES
jgi:hypothetical protein